MSRSFHKSYSDSKSNKNTKQNYKELRKLREKRRIVVETVFDTNAKR